MFPQLDTAYLGANIKTIKLVGDGLPFPTMNQTDETAAIDAGFVLALMNISLSVTNVILSDWKSPFVIASNSNFSIALNSVTMTKFASTSPVFYADPDSRLISFDIWNCSVSDIVCSSTTSGIQAAFISAQNENSRLTINSTVFYEVSGSSVSSIFSLGIKSVMLLFSSMFSYKPPDPSLPASTGKLRIAALGLNSSLSVDSSNFSNIILSLSSGGVFNLLPLSKIVIFNSLFVGCSSLGDGGIFNVGSNSSILIQSSTFRSNRATSSGGVVYCENFCVVELLFSEFFESLGSKGGVLSALSNLNLKVRSSLFSNCRATNIGAVFHITDKSFADVINVSFIQNVASNYGGVFYALRFAFIGISNSTFDSNSATGYSGGSLYLDSGVFDVRFTSFLRSISYLDGGAIFSSASNGTLRNCSFTKCSSTQGNGGALLSISSIFEAHGNTFHNNVAKRDGGALKLQSTTFVSSFLLFNASSATNGGGAFVQGGTFSSLYSWFSMNSVLALGGAAYIEAESSNLAHSTFESNTGLFGGAVYIVTGLNISDCWFLSNVAKQSGGAIAIQAQISIFLRRSILKSNIALSGGAIYSSAVNLSAIDCILEGNRASDGNGGAFDMEIYDEESIQVSSFLQFLNSAFLNNSCSGEYSNGGALSLVSSGFAALEVFFLNSSLSHNSASIRGGAFYSDNEFISFKMNNSIVSFNSAYSGGAIALKKSLFRFSNSKFLNNSAIGRADCRSFGGVGGVILIELYVICENLFEKVLFESNYANYFGGVLGIGQANACISNSTFRSNQTIFKNNWAKNYGPDFASLASEFVTTDESTDFFMNLQDSNQVQFYLQDHFGHYVLAESCAFDYFFNFTSFPNLIDMEFPLPYTIPIEISNFLPIRFAYISQALFPPVIEGLRVKLLISLSSEEIGIAAITLFVEFNISICPTGNALEKDDFSFFVCKECNPGYSLLQNATFSACLICPPGKTSSGSISSCVSCQPGFYSDVAGSFSCLACSAGRYAPLNASTSCTPCPKGKYTGRDKARSCDSCPSDSITFTESSFSLSQCTCNSGYYGNSWAGEECKRCPKQEGLSCDLNSTLPFVSNGWYRDPEDVTHVLKCIPSVACVKTEFQSTTTCETGYTGWLCGSCILGEYYKLERRCIPCGNSAIMWILLVILIIVCISILVKISDPTVISSMPIDIRITIGWLQMVSLYTKIASTWPVEVSWIFSFGSIFVRFLFFGC
jgi:predicted outer membrane repeat protein